MLTAFPALRNLQECRRQLCILTLCAVSGAIAGAAFAANTDHTYILLMRTAVSCRVSIVGTVIAVLPFLVSAFLLIHSKPWLVYPICGFSLFMLTSALFAIRTAFGSAGWLISLLQQFPALLLTPAILYLSFLRLAGQYSKKHLKYAIMASAVIGMIYYSFISPFLAELMDSYETMGRYAIHVGLDRCL